MTSPIATNNKNRKPSLTAKGDQRQYVNHCYHDRSEESIDIVTTSDENTLRLYREDSVGGPFPLKLQIVLKVTEKLGQQHIISWLPHGRSFMIHRPREFEEEVMGKFFKQTKLTSFRRQLNLYDFQRITHGRDAGSYYHELFLRGRPLLAKRMVRRKVKGTKIRASSSPDDEPNFYNMPFLTSLSDNPTNSNAAMGMVNHDPSMLGVGGGNFSSLSNLQGSLPDGTIGRGPHSLIDHSNLLQQQHALGPSPAALHQNQLYPGLMNPSGFNGMHLPQPYPNARDNIDYLALTSALQRNNYASSFGMANNYAPYGDPSLLDSMSMLNATGGDPRFSPFNKSLFGASSFPGAQSMAYPGNNPANISSMLFNQQSFMNEGQVPSSAAAQLLIGQMNQSNPAQSMIYPNNDDKQKAIEQLLLLQRDQSTATSGDQNVNESMLKKQHVNAGTSDTDKGVEAESKAESKAESLVINQEQSAVLAL